MRAFFSYLDYRSLLQDRFAQLKKNQRGVTHRSLAAKAGFTSPNFLKLVMDGQRNLSSQSLPKVGEAFGLTAKELEFFSLLVTFNQAKTIEEKDAAYDRMKALRRDLPLKRVEHSQFEYFENWYVVAIRELAALPDFSEDPKWIRSRLQGKVSLPQIRKATRLLERLGFLKRSSRGTLKPSEGTLTTGDEVASLGIYRYHQGMLKKAEEALHKTPPDFRDHSAITFSVSEKKFREIKKRIQEFRKEILSFADDDGKADTVYQMNVQLFNLSELVWPNS